MPDWRQTCPSVEGDQAGAAPAGGTCSLIMKTPNSFQADKHYIFLPILPNSLCLCLWVFMLLCVLITVYRTLGISQPFALCPTHSS